MLKNGINASNFCVQRNMACQFDCGKWVCESEFLRLQVTRSFCPSIADFFSKSHAVFWEQARVQDTGDKFPRKPKQIYQIHLKFQCSVEIVRFQLSFQPQFVKIFRFLLILVVLQAMFCCSCKSSVFVQRTGIWLVFTARCYASAVLAMGLCLSVSVCLSVCLSQVGVLLKRLNGGSHKQHHTIPQRVQFSDAKDLREILPESPPTRAPNVGGVGQNQRLLTNNRLYLENGKRQTHSFY